MAPLIGPPELSNPARRPHPPQPKSVTADPFMSLMLANFNNTTLAPNAPMGFTENGSRTFLSSANPCLDFFFHVVPNTPPHILTQRLHAAWAHNPLTTLNLLCNLRGVRGTGKSDKEGFYTAALWLHSLHPKTLACNLASFAEFGYFKDLPELIYRLLEGPNVRKNQKAEWMRRKRSGKKRGHKRCGGFGVNRGGLRGCFSANRGEGRRRNRKGKKSLVPREIRVKNAMERNKLEQEEASKLRREKRLAMAKKVIDRYSQDPDFRFLYDRVSDHFAECLKKDMKFYEAG